MHHTQTFDSRRLKCLNVAVHAIEAPAVSVFWFMDMLCCSKAERHVIVIAGQHLVLSPVTMQSIRGKLDGRSYATATWSRLAKL